MTYWHGKSALVTGGSAGLGLTLAAQLVTQGVRVAIVGRSAARLDTALERLKALGGDAIALQADVSQANETGRVVEAATEDFGGLDLACAAAGQSMRSAVVETPRAKFEELLRVNFLAAADLARAAGPHLEAASGHLVLIGSLASKVGSAHLGAYPASKFPLAALAQQLRLERGSEGLHTLLVCPGPLKREDGGARYDDQAGDLPDTARKPGGGAKVKQIDPDDLCRKILAACEARKAELVVPKKARLLFALSQLSPSLGDWLLKKQTGG